MSATLHLMPIGQDKTAFSISLLHKIINTRQHAFPTVWILVATRRQEMHFRRRLIEAQYSPSVIFNIEFFNFYTLNARLLKSVGAPVRRLTSVMRHKILRQILSQMLADGQLRYFHRIAETRGLISVLTELIDELKQSHIVVADFAKAARSSKDREIAAIYQRYQDTLRRSDLADIEGEGWLALAKLRGQNAIVADVDMLLVNGYDQFTRVQSELLAELARAVGQVHITLTALPQKHSTLVSSRSLLARGRLQSAFDQAGVSLDLRQVAVTPGNRRKALDLLGQNIFSDLPPAASGDTINLIEMPDPAEEARAVLREVKRLLLAGEPADGILIALRDWKRYAAYFEQGGGDYTLPLLLHYDRNHRRVPVIAALINLLELSPCFRRRDLLDALSSPYFDTGLDDRQVGLLDRVSLEGRFLGGGEAEWRELLLGAEHYVSTDNGEESLTAIATDQAPALASTLSTFISAITPPESGDLPFFISWLQALLSSDLALELDEDSGAYSLEVIRNAMAHEDANPAIVERDLRALQGLQAILNEMATGDDVLRTVMDPDRKMTWREFWSDLKYALETGADDTTSQPRRNQVLVTTATEARGLPHEHVFILGLSEGVFPAEAAENPLYLDSEREQLQTRGIPLATRAERVDDRGLFYELISLPRKTLTLSRPAYQAGRIWLESYLWRAVRDVFPTTPILSRPAGQAIHPSEAANRAELMLAIADQLGQQDAAQMELALRARNWLKSQPEYAKQWRRLERGRHIEIRRLSPDNLDEYSGVLSRQALLDEVAHLLGDDRIWSATQLNDFGLCPFRFFAKRLLALTRMEDPQSGADPAQLGGLNHRILEETYRKIRYRRLEIDEENQDEALEILAATAEEILPRAPQLENFPETSTWREEGAFLLKRLEALIKLDFSPKSPLNLGAPRFIFRQEEAIGEAKISLGQGAKPLRVTALIDRIDNADGKLVIADYKTGSTGIARSDMEIGRDFQMMIYLLALMSEFEEMGADEEVTGGMFWHLRGLKTSGRLFTDDDEDIAMLDLAKAHIARNLRMGRAGQFPVHASKLENGKCIRHCEFSRLCRKQVTARRDFQVHAATN
ncbi:MAG: PD-(D/E)XK nuclease family protein [Chloroflexi bacterium]|nr:PD-(D/E)XK nuclease family protein [Chloroflexota bacterium]